MASHFGDASWRAVTAWLACGVVCEVAVLDGLQFDGAPRHAVMEVPVLDGSQFERCSLARGNLHDKYAATSFLIVNLKYSQSLFIYSYVLQ